MRVGRLTVLLDRLHEVIFMHRALAHIAGGWIAKIPDLAVKCELARHAYEDLHAAHQLSGHATALRRGDDPAADVPAGTADAMRAIDAAPTADLMLVAMYGVARRHLFLAYDELGRTFDVILDGSLLYAAQPAIELLRRQLAYGQKVLE